MLEGKVQNISTINFYSQPYIYLVAFVRLPPSATSPFGWDKEASLIPPCACVLACPLVGRAIRVRQGSKGVASITTGSTKNFDFFNLLTNFALWSTYFKSPNISAIFHFEILRQTIGWKFSIKRIMSKGKF